MNLKTGNAGIVAGIACFAISKSAGQRFLKMQFSLYPDAL